MSKENIPNNNLSEDNKSSSTFEPEVGVFKLLDYDLDVNERRVKFIEFDYVLCENCNQEIDMRLYRCNDCYHKETDINEQDRMNYGICKVCFRTNIAFNWCSFEGHFRMSDYDLNLKEREMKYKNYDHVLCEKCNQEIERNKYYRCESCYYKETDINEKNRGSNVGIFKISDYDLNLKEKEMKYKNYDHVLCEKCKKEIDNKFYRCESCYYEETDINEKNRMKYGLNF